MLMIRMARFGAKKKPTYRVVLIEKRSGRDSAALEVLGHYNPVAQPTVVSLQHERIQHWVKRGAQMSDTVKRLVEKNPAAVEQPAA